MSNLSRLNLLRTFFESGATLDVEFRKKQLKAMHDAIMQHEQELNEALAIDLKKSPEEVWVTETGMVIAELNNAIKKVGSWAKPKCVSTNLLNLPSKSRIHHEPLGVVVIIGPWNYPFQLLINPLIGAIAAGNCVVLKPSEFAPATSGVMKKIVESVFASNYVLYLEGDGAVVVPALLNDFRFDHIFYTGSTSVGRLIYKQAADKLVPVTLELGGKSPCVIESDANLKVAARRIAITKFSNCGQMCVAPDYVLVHSSVREKFIEELKKTISQFFSGDAATSYNYGKIINEKQFDRLTSYLNNGRIVYGGKQNRASLYIEPTLLTDVKVSDPIMQDEIFGPLLPIIEYSNFEEAVNIVRQHSNPLSFYIYTTSASNEKKWLQAVPSGGACVNNSSWHLTNHNLPFGGRGNSGTGAYHGKYSFETFSHKKSVLKTPNWFDPAMKYPPFKGKLKLFKLFIR